MNLTALLSDCYRRLSYTTAPPSAITTRLTAFLNVVHRELLGKPGMDRLRDDTLTFASVSGQLYYGLPPVIERIESITDRTSMVRLREITQSDLRDEDPGLVVNGLSDTYINRGFQQVAVQPAAATGLWVVSTSAGDTQNAFIETVRTGGYRSVGAAVVVNGITRAQLGALTDHIEVVKFYLSTAAVGAVSLFDAAVAGNELARIPIGSTYARYLSIQLHPTPASALTYYVDYLRTIPDMANGSDEPLLPEDFHWLLIEGALVKEYTKVDDSRRPVAEKAYERGLSALRYFVNCPADFMPIRGGRLPERSRFGGNYPATRY